MPLATPACWPACALALALVSSLAVLMGGAGIARAAYSGSNGAIAFETFNVRDYGVVTASDAIKAGSRTIALCRPAGRSQPCDFGRPSYSPDGRMIVVTRGVPTGDLADPGGFGQG